MGDENGAEQPWVLLPEGEYAIVEVLGHRTLVGRITEVERFGTKLMRVEPIYQGQMLPGVLIGGGSIYQFTPCSAEVALARAPKNAYQLPASVAAALPPALLTAGGGEEHYSFDGDGDNG